MSGAVDLAGLAQPQRPPQEQPPAGPGGVRPVVAVGEADFEAEVLQRSMQVPVVVSIGAAEYPQSVQLDATLEQAAVAAAGRWVLATVDIRSAPRIAQAFGVQSVPTVLAVAAGRPVDAFAGMISEAELDQWISGILDATAGQLSGPPPAEAEGEPARDPRLVAAEELMDAGDLPGSIEAYEQILADEPGHGEATAAVRQLRFLVRAQEVPEDAVAAADAAPGEVDKQLRAADAELLAQQPDAAFGRLIAVVRTGAPEAKATARTRLLELLDLFDPADEYVIRARRGLANALY
ncbi:tetratricopeptide repeat protein [Tomitella gaofuii]|uniref:tetratricopeptide repeat protein n=1 Tax=Tomitella gaofuii TaxID=2760083 RepID=UPI0015FA10BF|nr:tetratricopeptide repeat protein [Tomitella gaofuii]